MLVLLQEGIDQQWFIPEKGAVVQMQHYFFFYLMQLVCQVVVIIGQNLQKGVILVSNGGSEAFLERFNHIEAGYIYITSWFGMYRLNLLTDLTSFYIGSMSRGSFGACSSNILEYAFLFFLSSEMSVKNWSLDVAGDDSVL